MQMEFVCGGELFTFLRVAGSFSNKMSSIYAAQVTLALEFCHGCEIVYRDLKPENLLLNEQGYIKVRSAQICFYI